MMLRSHFRFHSDLLWLCELPHSLFLLAHHAWKPRRMLNKPPTEYSGALKDEVPPSCGCLLPQISRAHPGITKPQASL